AVIFWDNSIALMAATLLYVVSYVWLYWRIVKFKTPRWMVKRDRRGYRPATRLSVGVSDIGENRDRRMARRAGFVRFRLPVWLTKRDRRHDPSRAQTIFRVVGALGTYEKRVSREEKTGPMPQCRKGIPTE
ncbi:MAG: hypothetical protein Q7U78_04660, partial [Gallionella sp.]|nr:hypothetical protein [Gallionella sp.]